MKNEERINGLETQIRTLKRIVCLSNCMSESNIVSRCFTQIYYGKENV